MEYPALDHSRWLTGAVEAILNAEGLDEKSKAAALLTAGVGVQDTADAIGRHRNTITNWMTEDIEFQGVYEALQTEMRTRVTGLLHSAAERAVGTLVQLLDADYEPRIRERAARTILWVLRSGQGGQIGAAAKVTLPNGMTMETLLLAGGDG